MRKKITVRQCPRCKAINPPVEEFCHSHVGTQCKNVIGKKFFGLLNKYCNSINEFDCEDDDWIYLKIKK